MKKGLDVKKVCRYEGVGELIENVKKREGEPILVYFKDGKYYLLELEEVME